MSMKDKKELANIVKRKLWTFGYRVKDCSCTNLEFDLIVENKMKVIVGREEFLNVPPGCDVYARVGKDKINYTGTFRGVPIQTGSPQVIFGKK